MRQTPLPYIKTHPIFFLILVCGLFGTPVSVFAQLPPDAQAAFDQGQQAVKDQKWPLAIQNFQEARKIAPNAPEVLYNLGVAESKIPGHELRAMAWYGAYLTALPDAPDAAAVKDQIAILHGKSQAYLTHLIKFLQDAATQVSGSNAKIAAAYAIASAQAKIGDFAGAQKTAAQIRDADTQREANTNIVIAQAQAGDISTAQKAVALTTDVSSKISLDNAIALAQADAGDLASAQATFQIALKTAGSSADPQTKGTAEAAIAKAQAQAGDKDGAKATIVLALQAVPSIKNAMYQSMDLNAIVEAQLVTGDLAGAQKTVALIADSRINWMPLNEVASAQIQAGDIAGAQKTAGMMPEAFYKIMTECNIAEIQHVAGDTAGAQASILLAQKAAAQTSNASANSPQWTSIAWTQFDIGDFDGAQISIAKITDAKIKKSTESGMAEERAKIAAAAGKNAPVERHTFIFSPQLTDGRPRLAPIAVSDWMNILNGELNTAPFPDLSGYLRTLPTDGSMKAFADLVENTRKATSAQNDIDWTLKKQAGQQAKPQEILLNHLSQRGSSAP